MKLATHRARLGSLKYTFTLAALVLAGWGTSGRAETATNAPKLHFDRTIYNFGVTSEVQSVTGTFTFQNTGTGVLKIDKPVPGCGCTVASVTPSTLEPGQKGELVFSVNLNGAKGPLDKHITVPSNDPANPRLALTIQAVIQPTYAAFPPRIDLNNIREGDVTNVMVQLRRVDGHKLVVTNMDCSLADCQVKLIPADHPADTAEQVQVEIHGTGAHGPFAAVARVYTDHPEHPEFRLPIYGNLVGDVMVAPEQLRWTIWNTGHWPGPNNTDMLTRKVDVSDALPGHALVISNFSSSIPELQVSAEPISAITNLMSVARGIPVSPKSSAQFRLVALLTNAPEASTSGTITFDTNEPRMPHVVIPVVIAVSVQKN